MLHLFQTDQPWLKNHSVFVSTTEVESNIDVMFNGVVFSESQWVVDNLNVIIGDSDVHMTNLSVNHKNKTGFISIYNSNLGFIQAVGCKVVISNSYINVTTTTKSHDTLIKVMASVVDIHNFRNDAEASPLVFLEAVNSEVTIRDSQFSHMDSLNSISLSNGSRLSMINTSFIQNTFLGGIVCAMRNCLLEITNCSFVANTGFYGLDMEENTTLKLEESTFVQNAAVHSGGVTNRLLLHRNVFEMTSISVNDGDIFLLATQQYYTLAIQRGLSCTYKEWNSAWLKPSRLFITVCLLEERHRKITSYSELAMKYQSIL